MKAVIPCAKKEKSLFPFTESMPTGMIPVMGKPIVKHLIHDLQENGVDDIYLVTNYREDTFRQEFEEFTNVNTITQEQMNGTGGAVERCSFIEEDFIVVNGDVVTSSRDIERLIQKHENSDSSATVLAATEDNPEKFGVLSINDDRVERLVEKPEEPENSLVNTGVYVFSPEIFDVLSDMEGEKELTGAVQKFVEREESRFRMVENYWIDIGRLKKLWKADRVKREHMIEGTRIHEKAEVAETAEIDGEAVVGKGAEIGPGAVLEGKVFIGENARIGPETVVSNSSVSDSCKLRNCGINGSLLFENCIIDDNVSVEDSVLGEDVDVKSNTAIRESFIGPRSFVELNNSIYGVKFVPDARTDLGEISK
ncbi:MAG: sugar phosphate nucleotidyltransferase [Candidatus Nanohaloarchaea archaeon]